MAVPGSRVHHRRIDTLPVNSVSQLPLTLKPHKSKVIKSTQLIYCISLFTGLFPWVACSLQLQKLYDFPTSLCRVVSYSPFHEFFLIRIFSNKLKNEIIMLTTCDLYVIRLLGSFYCSFLHKLLPFSLLYSFPLKLLLICLSNYELSTFFTPSSVTRNVTVFYYI